MIGKMIEERKVEIVKMAGKIGKMGVPDKNGVLLTTSVSILSCRFVH